MAKKTYGPGITVDSSSDFGPQEILSYINQLYQMKGSADANARVQEEHSWRQADRIYEQETRRKNKIMDNAFNTYTTFGIDTNTTANPNYSLALNQAFDYQGNKANAFNKYAEIAKSADTTPNRALFEAEWDKNYKANLNMLANRFSAVREMERVRTGIKDFNLLDRHMASKPEYNANNLFKEYASHFGVMEAQQKLGYSPQIEPESYSKKFENVFFKESYTDETGKTLGGGMTTATGAGTLLSIPAAGMGAYKTAGQYKKASEDILKQAKLDNARYAQNKEKITKGKNKGKWRVTGVKEGSGLSGGKDGKFFEKYKMLKNEAFDKDGKPTKKFNKYLRSKSLGQTTAGKAFGTARTYSGALAGGGAGAKAGELLAEALELGPVADLALTGTGAAAGAYGGQKIQRNVVNFAKQLSKPETIKRIKSWGANKGVKKGVKKSIMKALAKMGVSAAGFAGPQVLEPLSTAAGVAGMGWAAYDLYKIASEVPELMDIIFKQE
jgi:hypothetical protein